MAGKVFLFLVIALVALSFAPRVAAFGAGNIPSYSYLEDKAFRHGDIEDIIATLFKAAGGGFLSRGSKFTPLDVKRVYFGNWLRDYSQAVDVGGLSKTNVQTIINVVMVLGFLAHGYVTEEFEVTPERLGCYLPTEHIDNPKGYADGEDARKYHPGLRGPVDPQELEIDPQTGMKNYIANEGRHWDTSKSLVRRTLEKCIHYGRQFKSSGRKEDQYEAFLLLGQALHTLEDFPAHSNFCELALISLGHRNVFPHVGQNVKVQAPNGRPVFPIVTGTFGGADFIHSLMGEATDHLSQASVSDLSKTMANARSAQEGQSNSSSTLRQLFFDLPGGAGADLSRDMDDINGMRAGQPGGVDPSQMSAQELHANIWKILSFRDTVMKKIEVTIDRIPGLSGLVEKLTNSISVFIITTLEPFVKPLLGTATEALGTTSQAVIDSHDQEEVWNDSNASDPTHSFLSKDHFALLLNEPAGQIAKTIVEYSVNLVVKAWDDNGIPTQQVTEDILQCLFHPEFHDGRSQIQKMMLDKVRHWIDSSGDDKHEIINRLSADSVRQHRNKRIGDNSPDEGHVHNQLLPQGGLQEVLAQHNVHVPGAGILNAGQDLHSGKKPWDQGFGSGGGQAWRDVNSSAPNTVPPSLEPFEQTGQSGYQPPQQSYGSQGDGYPGQQYHSQGDGYPGQEHRQHQSHQSHGYDQGSQGGYGGSQGGYGGGQGGYEGGQGGYGGGHGGSYGAPPPPPDQWGRGGQPPYGGDNGQSQGYYGNNPPPPPPQGQGWGQPPQDQWGQGGGQGGYGGGQGGYGGGRQW